MDIWSEATIESSAQRHQVFVLKWREINQRAQAPMDLDVGAGQHSTFQGQTPEKVLDNT